MKRAAVLVLAAAIIALTIWSSIPAKATDTQPSDIYSFPQIQLM